MKENRRNLLKASSIVAVFGLVGLPLGVAVQSLMAKFFGAGAAMDAFNIAALMPMSVASVLVANVSMVFLPIFSKFIANRSKQEMDELVSSLLKGGFLVSLILGCLFYFFSDMAVHLLAPGFSPSTAALCENFFRWFIPTLFFLVLTGFFGVVLNAYYHFLGPSLSPLVFKIATFAVLLFLAEKWGVLALGGSFILSTLASAAVVFLFFSRYVRFDWSAPLFHPAYKLILPFLLPLLIFRVLDQVNLIIPQSYASNFGTGSVASVQYAWRAVSLPTGLMMSSLATAIFPMYTKLIAEGDRTELAATVSLGIRMVVFLALPLTAMIIVLGRAGLKFVFERGAFTAHDTNVVYGILVIYAAGILGFGLRQVLGYYFWSNKEYWAVCYIALLGLITNVATIAVSAPFMGVQAIALGFAVYTIIQSAGMFFVINRRLEHEPWKSTFHTVWKVGAASLGMGVGTFFLENYLKLQMTNLMQIFVSAFFGAVVFYLLARVLRISEMNRAQTMVLGKLKNVLGIGAVGSSSEKL